jgi:hypothetical protein
VREAVRVTLIAAANPESGRIGEARATYGQDIMPGSKKAGVFWHTQGLGKSISMACYAGKLLQPPLSLVRKRRMRCNSVRRSRNRTTGADCEK